MAKTILPPGVIWRFESEVSVIIWVVKGLVILSTHWQSISVRVLFIGFVATASSSVSSSMRKPREGLAIAQALRSSILQWAGALYSYQPSVGDGYDKARSRKSFKTVE